MSEFYLLGNTTITRMFGCIIKTSNKTIIFDGGITDDYLQIYDFLREKSDFHVDAWFFTHPHNDHIGAFTELCARCPNVQIDRIYYCFPSIEELLLHGDRGAGEADALRDMQVYLKERYLDCIHFLNIGECFSFDEVTIKVLRVYNPNIHANFTNNSSTVFRIENEKTSFLLLGDLGVEGGNEVMAICKKKLLQTDYTQMAHHGQGGVSKEFYQYIRPKRCIWAAPDWLWYNDAGEGFNTGPWGTVRTREWVEKMGVKEHFVEKDGLQKIEF